MEIGIDSFAAMFSGNNKNKLNDTDAIALLLDRMEYADRSGLDVFGIGEHHRKGFLDSAPALILAAAAARTKRIRLTSALPFSVPLIPLGYSKASQIQILS